MDEKLWMKTRWTKTGWTKTGRTPTCNTNVITYCPTMPLRPRPFGHVTVAVMNNWCKHGSGLVYVGDNPTELAAHINNRLSHINKLSTHIMYIIERFFKLRYNSSSSLIVD